MKRYLENVWNETYGFYNKHYGKYYIKPVRKDGVLKYERRTELPIQKKSDFPPLTNDEKDQAIIFTNNHMGRHKVEITKFSFKKRTLLEKLIKLSNTLSYQEAENIFLSDDTDNENFEFAYFKHFLPNIIIKKTGKKIYMEHD